MEAAVQHCRPLTGRLLVVAYLVWPALGQAADNFTLNLNVNGQTGSAGFSSQQTLFDKLSQQGLQSIVSTYTNASNATVSIDFRGLSMIVDTDPLNPAAVIFKVPGVIADLTFNSKATRDDNYADLRNFLKNDGGATMAAIQKKLAAVSPVDPIAGNPNSLQSLAAAGDFATAFLGPASNIRPGPDQPVSQAGLVALGLRFGSYSQAGLKSDSVTLPLSYTYRGWGSGRELTFSAPITSGTVGGAQAVQLGLGVAYRHPMNDTWALVPAVNVAAAGSADLGSAAALMSASLTSHYSFKLGGYDMGMGNMVGQYKTLKISTGSYSYDPGISNTVLRNGLVLAQPVNLFGRALSLEYSFINTLFSGSELYNNWTNEVGVTLGTVKTSGLPSYLRLGVTLLKGEKSDGFSMNFGYWF